MGGPKAWKEMQKRQKEFQNGWDAEPQKQLDSDDEDGPDAEKRDFYAEYSIDPETANEKEARGTSPPVEDDGTEDVRSSRNATKAMSDFLQEFTMAVMLRSLNIPLSIIGYDREQQRWSE
jgi:Swi5-dependent recombination DNA repair protein 1